MNQNLSYVNKTPPVAVLFAATVVMFFLSLSALESVGFVPYYVDGSTPASQALALSSIPQLGIEEALPAARVAPERILAPVIALDLPIQNPTTKDPEALDVLLSAGPVRYADSALLNQKGNMFLFAHSSHLPVVHNKMYKAFNRINELERDDLITVQGGGKDYVYRVVSVRHTDASEEMINLSPTHEPKLTLSTCDNFGQKSDRWVVEADFVASYQTT